MHGAIGCADVTRDSETDDRVAELPALPRLPGERGRAGVGALLVLLSGPAATADSADHPATLHDGRAAERRQYLALKDRRNSRPEAALGDEVGQLARPPLERGRRHRLGA